MRYEKSRNIQKAKRILIPGCSSGSKSTFTRGLAATLVAHSCMEHGVSLITRDSDFCHFAKYGKRKTEVVLGCHWPITRNKSRPLSLNQPSVLADTYLMRGIAFFFSLFLAACTTISARHPAHNRVMEFSMHEKTYQPPLALSTECKAFIASLPRAYRFGWVRSLDVPWRENSRMLYIFYYYLPIQGKRPTIFFNGGPAIASHRALARFEQAFIDHKQRLPVIFMDHRGTGCSSKYPDRAYSRDFAEMMAWGTTGIVYDAEQIRKQIGIEKWNIFGQSFGSSIVQRYIEQFPQSIHIAIGHGSSTINNYEDRIPLRMYGQLRTIRKYFEVYPEDKVNVKQIVRNRLCYQGKCGGLLLISLAREYMFGKKYWKNIHSGILKAIEQNQSRPLATATKSTKYYKSTSHNRKKSVETTRVFARNPQPSTLMARYLRSDILSLYDYQRCNEVWQRGKQMFGDTELLALSECWYFQGKLPYKNKADLAQWKEAMKNSRVNMLTPDTIRRSLEQFPRLQYWLFASTEDYYMPLTVMNLAASQLGKRVQYTVLPNAYHRSYLTKEVLAPLFADLDAQE